MEEAIYNKIKLNVKKLLNIDLSQYKSEQMQRRLDSWLVRSGVPNWDEYLKQLGTDSKELARFRDYLTINVSEFFRDQDRWTTVRTKIIPELARASLSTPARGVLRLWSAGCSNGSEPYTLAILLDELTPMKSSHYILATDLDRSILNKARARGPYSAEDIRNVSAEEKTKYFDAGGPPFFVKESLAKRVTFKEHNMLLEPFESSFDLLVCRNVIIYFTMEAKAELYKKFYSSLRPGGILFLGGTEIIPRPSETGFVNLGGSFYQKDSR